MEIGLKYDLKILLNKTIALVFEAYRVPYEMVGLSLIKVTGHLSRAQKQKLNRELKDYGLELINSHAGGLISQIKNEIADYIFYREIAESSNLSCYLSEKLGYSYAHLSSVFAANTHSTIENFVILIRIDAAKQMMLTGKYTLTEIAYSLNFSNVSHLSGQFKKVTGLTPSRFTKIIKNRENKALGQTL